MPELPEVETIRRQLAPLVTGRRIARVTVHDPLITAPVTVRRFQSAVNGRRIAALDRRGKYLLARLDSEDILVLHLRMTGILTHWPAGSWPAGRGGAGEAAIRWAGGKSRQREAIPSRHLRLVLALDDGSSLAFHDQRRFGRAFVLPAADSEEYWRRLGPEPLERSFNQAELERILDARRRPIKSLLLDQQLIAGIGNIYADEALYGAGIHPLRLASSLSADEAGRLTRAIKETLRHAIRLEGSSIDTYRTARGRKGRFQETFRVHRRAGEPCRSCGGAVEKIKVGGRGTYFCPECQR